MGHGHCYDNSCSRCVFTDNLGADCWLGESETKLEVFRVTGLMLGVYAVLTPDIVI